MPITPDVPDAATHDAPGNQPARGLSEAIISEAIISERSSARGEPDWLLEFRIESFRQFQVAPISKWVGDTSSIDVDSLIGDSTFVDSLMIDSRPKTDRGDGQVARRSDRAGTIGREESDAVVRRHREDLVARGVLFLDLQTAVTEHPELVRSHLGAVIPPNHSRFAALNSAVWSGGSFIYVPPGVDVGLPLQSLARAGSETTGPFERTLIVADAGSKLEYLEGCAAPIYTSQSLHSPVVEVIVRSNAHVTYTTVQNWSSNVVDVVTKRALVESSGHLSWIDANIGGHLSVSHPSVWLVGPEASGEAVSVAIAGRDQHHDTGAEMVHLAPNTRSRIELRTISKDGGQSSRRSLVRFDDRASGCESVVRYDSLALDDDAVFDSHPRVERGADDVEIDHRERASAVDDQQRFYLASRGRAARPAPPPTAMIVNGFIEPVTRRLPMEFAVEWNRLIEHQVRF